MRDIWIDDCSAGGIYYYIVMVDGKKYDEFVSSRHLTWSEQTDVAAGYREYLEFEDE